MTIKSYTKLVKEPSYELVSFLNSQNRLTKSKKNEKVPSRMAQIKLSIRSNSCRNSWQLNKKTHSASNSILADHKNKFIETFSY